MQVTWNGTNVTWNGVNVEWIDGITGLTATPVSSTQINLSWDSFAGATGYDVQRDGVVIATNVGTNSYSDTGLSVAGQLYTYRVRAVL